MPLTPAEMDELMDRHFAFEMADDVDGVLSTLAADACHDIVGAPSGPTIGHDETRPTYERVFADLAGERVETLHRSYGNNTLTDESPKTENPVESTSDVSRRAWPTPPIVSRTASAVLSPCARWCRKWLTK